jgi:predicted dehydrogenase
LVAVCDPDQKRAGKIAADFGCKTCSKLEDMLADPEVSIVNVLTPNHLHYDAVMKCAQAGRHVITEKPPAMSLSDTDDMIAACDRAGLKFACAVQCRVRASIQAVKKAVVSGRFGKLLHADACMKWFRATDYYFSDPWRSSRKSGAGVTIQHAFHYIDLLQYLAGPVARVDARMMNISHPAVQIEDTLLAFMRFRCGAQGVVEASTALWPGTDVRIEINGTDGTAIVTGEKMTTWRFREELPGDDDIRRLGSESQATAAGGAADFGFADHAVVIQNMIDAVNGVRDLRIPVASVRPALEAALAMYQSAARGGPVELPISDDPSAWDAPLRPL